MQGFELKGGGNAINVSLEKILDDSNFPWGKGNYEMSLFCKVKLDNYDASGIIYMWSDELLSLYKHLTSAQDSLSGEVNFQNTESNLSFNIKYDRLGHVEIRGFFRANPAERCELQFYFESDQSYIKETITGLHNLLESIHVIKP